MPWASASSSPRFSTRWVRDWMRRPRRRSSRGARRVVGRPTPLAEKPCPDGDPDGPAPAAGRTLTGGPSVASAPGNRPTARDPAQALGDRRTEQPGRWRPRFRRRPGHRHRRWGRPPPSRRARPGFRGRGARRTEGRRPDVRAGTTDSTAYEPRMATGRRGRRRPPRHRAPDQPLGHRRRGRARRRSMARVAAVVTQERDREGDGTRPRARHTNRCRRSGRWRGRRWRGGGAAPPRGSRA